MNPRTYSFWYISPAADDAIDTALAARRKAHGSWVWDPRTDSWSLATLRGKAKKYGGRYASSRARLLAQAGVIAQAVTAPGSSHRRVTLVTMPGEPITAAGFPAGLLPKG